MERRGEVKEKKTMREGPEMRSSGEKKKRKRRGNNAYWEEMERKEESSERKQWGRKEKAMGVKRYEWVM